MRKAELAVALLLDPSRLEVRQSGSGLTYHIAYAGRAICNNEELCFGPYDWGRGWGGTEDGAEGLLTDWEIGPLPAWRCSKCTRLMEGAAWDYRSMKAGFNRGEGGEDGGA